MARAARKPSFARTAYLKQTLAFYDGPQVILMQSDRGFPMIAVAVGEPTEDSYPVFISEFTDENLRRYLREKVDLRYLFRGGSKRRYVGDWAQLDEHGWLSVGRADDITDESYFPRQGFWSRHHTSEYGVHSFAAERLASFAIDGSWDASDFSRFYGRVADLYAYLAITSSDAADRFSGLTTSFVKNTIRSLGWKGGGSYVGFYDTVFSKIDSISPLRVNRIAYASPGTIELKGDEQPLADIEKVVDRFGSDDGALKHSYDFVYKVLGKEDLRTAAPDKTFSTDEARDHVIEHCFTLNRGLGVDAPENLLALCEGNAVVFSKITLSFYRRAKELHAFHAEGRVESQGVRNLPENEV